MSSMELVSKQLVLSGQLKPEARLGLAISEFAQKLDGDRRKQFLSMRSTQHAHISGRDIIKMTEEINQEGARRHHSWRPHGTKVGGFLSRIQTFASIGDVLVGGSQNLIATGVWSAVRLSLTINVTEVATSYLSYFEKLSTLFMRLDTSWALHEDFAQLFPTSERLQAYFCEYLVVLMKLCNKIVVFCQKTTGAQLFSSLGSSFDSEFGPVQKELDQWGCLIQQQTQFLSAKINIDTQKGRFQDVKQRILHRLSPYQNDFETKWRRQRKKGTCEWIFDTLGFKDWNSMQTSATLSINGKLGSGKTVSMANIVARINLDQPCAYVFCAAQESTSLKAANILGSIAFTLVDNLPAEAAAQKRVKQTYKSKAFDPETIIDLLLSLLREDRKYIVIVDGLENCSDAEIDDVLFGLRRLMQNRVFLVCYSSRSDSWFQHVAKKHFAPQFSISLDDLNHDMELEAYIVEEVSRRNQTRHLKPDLEELVQKQLIAGAQGMYLWVSLQLDTIFPSNSKVVFTDDQILNLITNLPRDLPEAFEQALEGIPDRKYEGRIMKLVMSAVDPLELNEIRIALCVEIGEPVWRPEKIAKDGAQLLSLTGGNLLELDEEDGKVRFIHHSVIQHLLSPATSQSTTPYHFTVEEAENYTGATCVTYLQLPVLDSRITVSRNLQSMDMLNKVVKTTRQSHPVTTRLIEHIKSREQKRARPSHINIGQLFAQIEAARIQEDLDPRCFAAYATKHWVFHTRFFDEENQDCKKSWRLWLRLLYGSVATVKQPCPDIDGEPFPVLMWAAEHGHGSLFRTVLAGSILGSLQVEELIRNLELHKSIRGQWLGDLLARYLQSLHSIEMPSTSNNIKTLLDLDADPHTPHHTSDSEPLNILARRICADTLSDGSEQELIREVFAHPTVLKSLGDRSVLGILRELDEGSNVHAVVAILALHPNLEFEFQRKRANQWYEPYQPTANDTQPAIEKALDTDEWENVGHFGREQVNYPTLLGTSVLWKAIETKSDAWVYHLLRLGADPNAGPFTMRQYPNSPLLAPKCFPLEAALRLRRTRVCLELLRSGAVVDWFGKSLIRIAQETGNLILAARLYEEPAWFERLEYQQRNENERTALSTACKMLSHSGSGEPPGFPRPLPPFDVWDWRSELDKIIYRLALDGNVEYVNAQDAEGRTALHYVTEAKNTDDGRWQTLVNLLLGQGADPNIPDFRGARPLSRRGATPLMLAIWNSAPVYVVIEPLLRAGADPNEAHEWNGFRILEETMNKYRSSREDMIRLVRLLLQSGADPRDKVFRGSVDSVLISTAKQTGNAMLIDVFKQRADKLILEERSKET